MNASKKLLTLALTALALSFSNVTTAQEVAVGSKEPTVAETPNDPSNNEPRHQPPVSLEENRVQKLMLYPNPNIGSEFTMDLPLADSEPIVMQVFDMNGRMVETKNGTYAELQHFRFRNLEEATYLIRVFSKDAFFQSRVIIIH